ncbi:alpha/beta hydrolase [Nocardia sp. AG03]|uniref:alpha/beta hydrolase fold domain-containing protein n=1 Tax=Nocardia sp. AG03 TaxID=3025312 RepID=UPI00241885D2|nr:alpha/beta hydrolase [Nocardia sp. AG03]
MSDVSVLSRFVLPAFLRLTRRNRKYVDVAAAHAYIARCAAAPASYQPPTRLRGVTVTSTVDQGRPVFTLTPLSGRSRGGLIYAHGGGWVGEIVSQHWRLAARLAAELDLTVTVPIYPLIPTGTAAQVIPWFAELFLASTERYGPTFLVGDSAGGQIVLSTALHLRDTVQVKVPRTVVISPAVDLTLENPAIDDVLPDDPWLGREGALVFGEHWRGELPMKDPMVSPLFGDFTGLGPLTVFSSTHDILNPDTRLLIGKARAADVEVDYHERAGLVHVYPLTPTPEGAAARHTIVEILRADLTG